MAPIGLPDSRQGPGRRMSGRADVRRIALVNLMPDKAAAVRQFGRLLARAPAPASLTLTIPDGYRPKTASAEHMAAFYRPWSALDLGRIDGVIVTGAPLEHLPYAEVRYWPALAAIFDDLHDRGLPGLHVCWAAQAYLWQRHGVPKHPLAAKAFGVYRQRVVALDSPLLAGFGASFPTPVSRHSEVRRVDLPAGASLRVLAESPATGLCLVEDGPARQLLMFNHLEYEAGTLEDEYRRDLQAGRAIAPPLDDHPQHQVAGRPRNHWRPYGERLMANWLRSLRSGVARVRR